MLKPTLLPYFKKKKFNLAITTPINSMNNLDYQLDCCAAAFRPGWVSESHLFRLLLFLVLGTQWPPPHCDEGQHICRLPQSLLDMQSATTLVRAQIGGNVFGSFIGHLYIQTNQYWSLIMELGRLQYISWLLVIALYPFMIRWSVICQKDESNQN